MASSVWPLQSLGGCVARIGALWAGLRCGCMAPSPQSPSPYGAKPPAPPPASACAREAPLRFPSALTVLALLPQKGFTGGKVSLLDCFSLFTKEEELDSENAPVSLVLTARSDRRAGPGLGGVLFPPGQTTWAFPPPPSLRCATGVGRGPKARRSSPSSASLASWCYVSFSSRARPHPTPGQVWVGKHPPRCGW